VNCPACLRPLHETAVRELTVDVCRNGCAGIWLDRWELRKVDADQTSEGECLLALPARSPLAPEHVEQRFCPRDLAPLRRHYVCDELGLEVDSCVVCAGLWIEPGELGRIYQSRDPGDEAASEVCRALARSLGPALESMRCASDRARARAEQIDRALRWLLPTRWLSAASPR
jgi:Zn-finger nucleic acid-binding protein